MVREDGEKLKLALLGCGDVAQRDYLPEMHRLANRVELVAVCSRTENRARATAEAYGIATWYTDYTRMLMESEADAVINLTPIQLHFETNVAVLEAGKHLYTEKPLATTKKDAQRIHVAAQQRRLKVVSAPCVMLFPQVRLAHSLLQEGVIGRVASARAYGHGGVPPWSGYTSDPSPFFAKGAGPAMDMGVYPLHALTGLLGPARKVTAMTAKIQQRFVVVEGPFEGMEVPVEVDDNWHMVLDFGEGRLASVSANNCVQGTRAPELELFGLQGTIALSLLDVSASVEVLRSGGGWEQKMPPRTGRLAGPDHLLGIEHLVDCVRDNSEPLLNAAHAIHVLEIIEGAALAAAEGKAVTLHTTF